MSSGLTGVKAGCLSPPGLLEERLPSTIAALERVPFFSAATNRQDDFRRVSVSRVGVEKTVQNGVVAVTRKSPKTLRNFKHNQRKNATYFYLHEAKS